MNSISYPCPLCDEQLIVSEKGQRFNFFCESCGFTKTAPQNYSLKDAYKWIKEPKKRPTKTKKTGFRTSRGKQSLSDHDVELLEDDLKIQENAKKIRESLNDEVPEVLKNVFSDESHLPVFYRKFPKSLPKLDKKVNDDGRFSSILRNAIQEDGIEEFYEFQTQAFDIILDKQNVVIAAPTGLGKTEAFLLPILQSCLNEKNPKIHQTKAILVYPTKALAADQLRKIQRYCGILELSVQVFDGDTSQNDRDRMYRTPPDIIITNPDMIHYHLMGNFSFQTLIKSIQFLVLDEIHQYISAFGSNVLWIVRRLRRFAKFTCIGVSATIANPDKFASTIFDESCKIVSVSTARKSDMHLSMVYPIERSNLSTMAKISEEFVKQNHKTLVFGNGHLMAEVVNLMLRQSNVKSQIHRAGLPISHRKKVENLFKTNKIDALVSTPTLELGIDIGDLDSVVSILTGLTSFVQRIGRAGRQGQESYATLVLRGDDPISVHYARNPDDYLSEIDPVFVEPNNSFVSFHQFIAMISDRPLSNEEAEMYPELLNRLEEENIIIRTLAGVGIRNPKIARQYLSKYSIRGIGNSIQILFQNQTIGERNLPIALKELHPGAIYLHGGKSFRVNSYDDKLLTSKVTQIKSNHERTQALREIWPEVDSIDYERNVNGMEIAYCDLNLTETVNGFMTKNVFNGKTISTTPLVDPISYEFNTKGFIMSVPKPFDFVDGLDGESRFNTLGGTFHAVEHILIESGNSLTGSGANQIGGISMGDTGLIFVYDGIEGGSGLSKLLFDKLDKSISRSLNILKNCPCNRVDGCPRCTYSYYCGNNNQPLNRLGAIEALNLVGKESTEIDLSYQGAQPYVIEVDSFPLYFAKKKQS